MNSQLPSLIQCSDIRINLQSGDIIGLAGTQARLSPLHTRLVILLINHQGNVIERSAIFDKIWPNQEVSDDALTKAISEIRGLIASVSDTKKFIETVPKRGYRWVIPLETNTQAAQAPAEDKNTSASPRKKQLPTWLKWLPVYLAALCLSAGGLFWSVKELAKIGAPTFAVLSPIILDPESANAARAYYDALYQALLENKSQKVLSQKATTDQGLNVYPQVYRQFGVKWVVEVSIRSKDKDHVTIVTSLVDAQSALVIAQNTSIQKKSDAWEEALAKKYVQTITPYFSE